MSSILETFEQTLPLAALVLLVLLSSVYLLKDRIPLAWGPSLSNNFGYGDIRVSKLLVHPIKSCKGTSVQSSRYTPSGLENDRKWSIIDLANKKVLTAREYSRLVLITPRIIEDETCPHGGYLDISFPADSGCESFQVPLRPTAELLKGWKILDDIDMWSKPIDGYICQSLSPTSRSPAEIISSFLGAEAHLVYKGPKTRECSPTSDFPELKATHVFQDGYPLLMLSQESVGAVQTELRKNIGVSGIEEKWREDELVIERFRPNVVFSGGPPFAEDHWQEISIQSEQDIAAKTWPRFVLVSKCTRCLLPNVSPETGVPDKAVPFKVLTKFRIGVDRKNKYKPCLGDNACPLQEGVLRVGDKVRVMKVYPPDL